MTNVLLCTPYLQSPEVVSGGIGIWANNILHYYSKLESSIAITPVSFDRKYRVKETDSAIKRLSLGLKDYWGAIRNAFARIDEGGVDVLHLCTSAELSLFKDLYILKRAKRKGVKTVVHFHFGRIPKVIKANNWEGKMVLKVCRAADSVIVMDKSSYLCLEAKGFTNIHYVPNPLSESIIKEVAVHEEVIERVERKVLFVGHVIVTKGVYELVKACLKVPEIELHIVGTVDEAIKADLLAIAKQRDDGSWLKMRGSMSHNEVINEMLSARYFVLPSYTEGFPNVILESMASSCTILATRVGAIPEMLDFDSYHPCGVELIPQSVESIEQKLSAVVGDKEMGQRLGQMAKEKVLSTYSIPIVWEQLAEIWSK